jgi:cardiolipin synthase
LLLPSRSNHLVTFHAGRSCYDRLLAAGVRIAEYAPGMIHAKAILVDDELAMVGSSNLDLRSFRLNFEIQVLIDDPELIRALGAAIADCHTHSLEIQLGPWRARGLRLRLGEGAARLLSPLL